MTAVPSTHTLQSRDWVCFRDGRRQSARRHDRAGVAEEQDSRPRRGARRKAILLGGPRGHLLLADAQEGLDHYEAQYRERILASLANAPPPSDSSSCT